MTATTSSPLLTLKRSLEDALCDDEWPSLVSKKPRAVVSAAPLHCSNRKRRQDTQDCSETPAKKFRFQEWKESLDEMLVDLTPAADTTTPDSQQEKNKWALVHIPKYSVDLSLGEVEAKDPVYLTVEDVTEHPSILAPHLSQLVLYRKQKGLPCRPGLAFSPPPATPGPIITELDPQDPAFYDEEMR
ncbi:hypothetical protein HDU91_004460 [Kappamyces sp. JEL0680]|nr:hypothetical protein HDU91_004460 [Kappamyces sp. JEL0680]